MLVVVGIVLIFGLVVLYKWKNEAAKKEDILRLVAVASEEEEKIVRLQAFEEYSSPPHPQSQLEKQYYCAVCHCLTSTRCSRCKTVRYCSGKCQIIHWRQGHKDECLPATSPGVDYGSRYDVETASENQSATHLQNKVKICSDDSKKFNDSRSSSSSTSCSYSSTERSESSFDASTSEVVEFGTPIQPNKAPSVGIRSHMSKPISRSGDVDMPSLSPPIYSVNHPPGGSKIEMSKADERLKSTSIRDKIKGDGIGALEEFGQGGTELKAARPSSAARTFSTEDTRKGLKTSVRKFVQHFKALNQSNMVIDLGGLNHKQFIFPVKLFMQLYSCNDVELHPYGLVNCGNSCYANAVLQCLMFTRPIASYLLHGLHSKTCRKMDWCFICKFEHLIHKGQAMNSPISPVGLLSQIQPIGREEDAHEFLRNVVDKMQSTFLEEAGPSSLSSEDSSLMGLTFGGSLQSKIKCLKCSGRSERIDRMMDLTVGIDGNIRTLEDALMQFTISETLGGDDKYKCSRCKSYEKAKKKLTVLEAPNILTIVLKRFGSGNLEKLNKVVKFPDALNLSPYMSGMNDKYPIYYLYAVVVHLGMNAAHNGHYVSYVKDFRGQWFKIDDSLVSRVDLRTVLSVEASILFYARRSPRCTSLVRSTSHSDAKTNGNTEALSSSSNPSKKKNSKMKPNSSGRHAGPASPGHVSSRQSPHWMSQIDFTGSHEVDPSDQGFHENNPLVDSSSSDSSSIFSTSDAGSSSTDGTKDSSTEDISGFLFGSSWYQL